MVASDEEEVELGMSCGTVSGAGGRSPWHSAATSGFSSLPSSGGKTQITPSDKPRGPPVGGSEETVEPGDGWAVISRPSSSGTDGVAVVDGGGCEMVVGVGLGWLGGAVGSGEPEPWPDPAAP